MNERLFRFILLFLAAYSLSRSAAGAQEGWPEDVIVLVDVSGSMSSPSYGVGYANVRQARDLVDALLSDTLDISNASQWSVTTTGSSGFEERAKPGGDSILADKNSKVYFGLLGDRDTTIQPPQLLPDSVIGGNLPPESRFKDQTSYILLGRAKAKEFAEKRGIRSFLLLEITDAQTDEETNVEREDTATVNGLFSENCKLSLLYQYNHKGTGNKVHNGRSYQLKVNCWKISLLNSVDAHRPAPVLSGLGITPEKLRVSGTGTAKWVATGWDPREAFTVSVTPDGKQDAIWTKNDVFSTTLEIPSPPAPGAYHLRVEGTGESLTIPFEVISPPAPEPPPPLPPPPPSAMERGIVILSPQAGVAVAAGEVRVTWRVDGPATESEAGPRQFRARVTGDEIEPINETVSSMQWGVKLEKAGEYRLTVTSQDLRAGSLRFTVEGGSGIPWALLLTLILVGVVLILVLRRRNRGEDEGGAGARTPPAGNGFRDLD